MFFLEIFVIIIIIATIIIIIINSTIIIIIICTLFRHTRKTDIRKTQLICLNWGGDYLLSMFLRATIRGPTLSRGPTEAQEPKVRPQLSCCRLQWSRGPPVVQNCSDTGWRQERFSDAIPHDLILMLLHLLIPAQPYSYSYSHWHTVTKIPCFSSACQQRAGWGAGR